jgi:cell division protein ZapB
MIEDGPQAESEHELLRLERQVDALIELCGRLREENRSLRSRQEQLVAERADLLDKTDTVQGRVEAIMSRLRAIEPTP